MMSVKHEKTIPLHTLKVRDKFFLILWRNKSKWMEYVKMHVSFIDIKSITKFTPKKESITK